MTLLRVLGVPGVSVVLLAKHADEAKSRLELPRDSARDIALLLAARTLQTALGAGTVGSVSVVTRDEAIAKDAIAAGAEIVWEGSRSLGMNRAAELGRREVLATRPRAAVVVLVADLPRLQPEDIDALVEEFVERGEALLVADRNGDGTTALICGPDQELGSAFGRGSSRMHLRLGYRLAQQVSQGLRCDLDTWDDLRETGVQDVVLRGRMLAEIGVQH